MRKQVLLFSFFLFSFSGLCGQIWSSANPSYDGSFDAGKYKRHECGAVSCTAFGQHLGIVLGGRGSGDQRRPIIYDYKANSLTMGAQAPKEIHHFQGVTWRDSIAVLGMAMTGPFPNEFPLDNLYLYSPSLDAWVEYDSIPAARRRGSTQAVIDGDWVYFFNGLTIGHKWGWTTKTDRYNLATKTWEILADSPRARDHGVAVKDGNLVYIVGGRRSNAGNAGMHAFPQLKIDVYDLSTDTWDSLPSSADLPGLRGGLMAALQTNALGHKQINVWGGEYQTNTYSTGIGLDLITNTWNPLPSLSTTMHGNQIIQTHTDSIYLIAGAISGGNEKQVTSPEYIVRSFPAPAFPIYSAWGSLDATPGIANQVEVEWTVEESEGTIAYEIDFKDGTNEWNHTGTKEAVREVKSLSYREIISPVWKSESGLVRVRTITPDGTVSVSPSIEVTKNSSFFVYPNPFTPDQETLHLGQTADQTRLYGPDGRQILESSQADSFAVPLSLAPGLYYITLVKDGRRFQSTVQIK